MHLQPCDNVAVSHVALSRTALLAALSGCNPFYGLDRTELIDAAEIVVVDLDEDGVLDVVDVCPDMPNPLQEDTDGDKLGDLCDPCATGSNHNEDGDGHLDGCDNCPHVANEDQANTDLDDLGDACDRDNESHEVRSRFDSFDVLANDWIPGSVEWVAEADTAHLTGPASDNELGMWNRRAEVNGNEWMIETHFRGDAIDGVFGGIRTRQNIGTQEYLCYVQYDDSSGWRLGTPMMVPVTVPVTDGIRLRVIFDQVGLSCEANGVSLAISGAFIPSNRTHPGLTANSPSVRFDYVEAVSTP